MSGLSISGGLDPSSNMASVMGHGPHAGDMAGMAPQIYGPGHAQGYGMGGGPPVSPVRSPGMGGAGPPGAGSVPPWVQQRPSGAIGGMGGVGGGYSQPYARGPSPGGYGAGMGGGMGGPGGPYGGRPQAAAPRKFMEGFGPGGNQYASPPPRQQPRGPANQYGYPPQGQPQHPPQQQYPQNPTQQFHQQQQQQHHPGARGPYPGSAPRPPPGMAPPANAGTMWDPATPAPLVYAGAKKRADLPDVFMVRFGPGRMGFRLEQQHWDGSAVVTNVNDYSDAAQGGVLVGDQVVALENHPVQRYDVLMQWLQNAPRPLAITFCKRAEVRSFHSSLLVRHLVKPRFCRCAAQGPPKPKPDSVFVIDKDEADAARILTGAKPAPLPAPPP